MAALPHAQPTIMEVEGSERPVQREVALCDVIEDKAKKEMACVSFHKNLKTKIWTTIPPFHSRLFQWIIAPFWGVLLIWTFFRIWAASDMAILQRRLQPALQCYNKWFFERRRGSYRIEPNHWKALAIASESAGTPDHLGAYFMCDCHQGAALCSSLSCSASFTNLKTLLPRKRRHLGKWVKRLIMKGRSCTNGCEYTVLFNSHCALQLLT